MKILRSWLKKGQSFLCAGVRRKMTHDAKALPTVVLTQYHIETLQGEQFRAELSKYIFSSRLVAGNIMIEAYAEQGDPSIVWVFERWRDRKSYHQNSRTMAAVKVSGFEGSAITDPVEQIFLNDLEMISRATGRNGTFTADESITVMLFIEVNKGTENYFRQINQVVVAAFQEYPDVLSFRLSEVVGQKTRFVVYKKFSNREAFQAHLKDPVVRPVIQFLQTSVRETPFEKGYHHLVELK